MKYFFNRSFIKRSMLGLGALLLSSGITSCASYRASSLDSLSPALVMQQRDQTKKMDICAAAKAFNQYDCERYLDRDLITAGYQPVQLYIENNSSKPYVFSTDWVSLKCASLEEVTNQVHTSTLGRVTGYTVGSLFAWPLIIPAVVDGIKSSNANKRLDKDFSFKIAKNTTIFPYSKMNKIIFIPIDEYESNFTIHLVDSESKNLLKIDVNTL
jgi:hypothetical protein